MKKITGLLAPILALLISLPTHAEQRNAKDKSLLWKISGKNLARPSYLFGTIHLICPEDYIWTDKMKESFSKSDKICFEMDISDPSVMMQAAAGMMDTSGKTLQDYFTPEQYALLKQYVKDSLGMDMTMLANMRPVMLESIVSTSAGTCDSPVSYEERLMQIALDTKKDILGLETPAEQISVLASIPVDTVIKDVMDEIQNHNSSDTEYVKLIAAYKNQDLPQIYHLLMSSKDVAMDMGMFLDERNKKWISRMTGKMQDGSVFFAVGAGHLWGDNGVISLLRKQGYVLEPIK